MLDRPRLLLSKQLGQQQRAGSYVARIMEKKRLCSQLEF